MSRTKKVHRDKIRQYLRSHGVNTAPGSINAQPDAPQPVITVIAYNANNLVEQEVKDLKEIESFIKKYPVTWVNVDGFGDIEKIKAIAALFKIHNLALEDVMTFHQRAKVESYDNQYYIVAHMLEWVEGEIRGEQLNIFLGKNFVVTFQDGPIDCMNPVRDRLRKGVGKLRSSGPDYLAYSLLDSVIDTFFPILENYGDSLENLEEQIIEKPTRKAIAQIHKIKRELLLLRRAIWPLREAINSLLRDTPEAFAPETLIHLRDCYDHTVQILDFIETYRELSADLQDVYLSSISNRMNEIMKVLTIVSTLCVPPTLVAGIYGMNFDTKVSHWNMPELTWYYGYPFALGLMLIIVVITLAVMWSKGWLGDNPFSGEDISPSDLAASDSNAKSITLEQNSANTSSAGAKPMTELASATPHHIGQDASEKASDSGDKVQSKSGDATDKVQSKSEDATDKVQSKSENTSTKKRSSSSSKDADDAGKKKTK
ncbi:MAG TPA: magnesium/cobalt transporter CorA [Drouetiella sp.]